MMIANSNRDQIYDHEIELLNFSYSEEFRQVH